jgi:hypothetical protein
VLLAFFCAEGLATGAAGASVGVVSSAFVSAAAVVSSVVLCAFLVLDFDGNRQGRTEEPVTPEPHPAKSIAS